MQTDETYASLVRRSNDVDSCSLRRHFPGLTTSLLRSGYGAFAAGSPVFSAPCAIPSTLLEEDDKSFIERVIVGVNDSPGTVAECDFVIHLDFKPICSPALCWCGRESSASSKSSFGYGSPGRAPAVCQRL